MDSRRSAPTYPTKEELTSEWRPVRATLRAYIEWSTVASDDTLEVIRQVLPDSWERPLMSLPLETWVERPDLDTTAAGKEQVAAAVAAGSWPGGNPAPLPLPLVRVPSMVLGPTGLGTLRPASCGAAIGGCIGGHRGCPGVLYEVRAPSLPTVPPAAADKAAAAPAGPLNPFCVCACQVWPAEARPGGPRHGALLRPAALFLRSKVYGLLPLLSCGQSRRHGTAGPAGRGAAGDTGAEGRRRAGRLMMGRMSAMYFHRALRMERRLSTPWRLRLEWLWRQRQQGKQVLCPAARAALRVSIPPVSIWRHPGPAAFPELKWRLLMGKLPLMQCLRQVEDQTCASCGPAAPTETAEHAFKDCQQAKKMWGRLRRVWETFPMLPAFPVTVGPLLFSSGLGQLAAGTARVAVALLDTGRHVIWNQRWRARNAVAPRVGGPTVAPCEWQVTTRATDALLTELLGSLIWGRFAGMERGKFLQ
ncbi:unnamed protein product, partial [Phaeothamnion confervicola]